MSNTWDSVSSAIQTPRIWSKVLGYASPFKLSSDFLVFGYPDETLSFVFDMLHVYIQSNLRLRPPFLSDQFSKIPNVSESNHYIWNILQATISRMQTLPLLQLQVWNFPLFLISCKQPLDRLWGDKWIIRCCNNIVFLAGTRNENFSMGRTFFLSTLTLLE